MKPRYYRTKFARVLSLGYNAITLCPFGIFMHPDVWASIRVRNHEAIHWAQQKELWLIGFYLLYVLFWVWGVIRYRSFRAAYQNNAFEAEAYAHDVDDDYLRNRKPHSWRRYT